jgi:hypothetical protein
MSAVVSNTSNRAPEEEDPEYEEEEEDYEDEEKDGGSGMTALLAGGGGAVALAAIATIVICCCLYGRGATPAADTAGKTDTPPAAPPAKTGTAPGSEPPEKVEGSTDATSTTSTPSAEPAGSMARSKDKMGGASGASTNNPKFSGLGVVGVIMMIVAGALYYAGKTIPTPGMPWMPNPIYIMAGVGAACTLAGMAGCYRGGAKSAANDEAVADPPSM